MATKKTKTVERKQTRPTFGKSEKDKSDRFAFYATLRMSRTLKLINQLKNLTNPVIYTSTQEQRRKMIDTLQTALKEVENIYFAVTGDGKSNKFQF